MQLIPQTTPETIPPAQQIAERMIHHINAELAHRVDFHAKGFRAFWDSPETPDAILAAMGQAAPLVLGASRENLRNIGTLAAMVGKTLDDFISPADYEPRREFVVAQDGTITLAPPAEGFDAWGRKIIEETPEI